MTQFNFTQFQQWWQQISLGQNFDWLHGIGFLLLGSLISWTIWVFIYNRMHRLTEKTKNQWDDIVIYAIQRPISFLLWAWPILFALQILIENTTTYHALWIKDVRELVLAFSVIWVLLRLIRQVEAQLIELGRDHTTINAIAKILRILVCFMGALALMQQLGWSLSGILTFGGVGGLIVGMAAKDLLANFFGGLMIYLDRPFKVGDWIRSPDRNIEGIVERIGFRMTIIRTFDKRPLYIPNMVFSSVVVENPSRMLNRRIYETIGLRYDDATVIAPILADVEAMLRNDADIDVSQTLMVNFNQFANSSLDFFIYTFTKTTDWVQFHKIKQRLLLEVHQIIQRHGADIAFPTQTLRLKNEAPEPAIVE